VTIAGRHQRVRQEVDDENLADILAGHVGPGFFDSLTVESIVRMAQLEMEQQKATGVHDDAIKMKKKKTKKKQSFQRGLRMQKTIQQPWPLGPEKEKSCSPFSSVEVMNPDYSLAEDMNPNCSGRTWILSTSAAPGNVGGREK
jgi:hypothetical protein